MPLLTQYASFYISPFGETTVTDELNIFLRSHRIVNVEKRLIDGERGTGAIWLQIRRRRSTIDNLSFLNLSEAFLLVMNRKKTGKLS